MIAVADIARMLAERIDALVYDLLPAGHREGAEWRCGSVVGERGNSLGVRVTGDKAGIWSDFSTGQKGDALDLVGAVLGLSKGDAIGWAKRWLGLEDGDAALPARPASASTRPASSSSIDWRTPWRSVGPIGGTIAERYLGHRGLRFDDPDGDVLRFAKRHARRSPAGELEHHPALLALLRDISTCEPSGIINVYLLPDGADRIRDKRGKTSWGRAGGSAVMLNSFDDVTLGLVLCEGVETGISLLMANLAPVWCCGGAGNLGSFPLLAGIEALSGFEHLHSVFLEAQRKRASAAAQPARPQPSAAAPRPAPSPTELARREGQAQARADAAAIVKLCAEAGRNDLAASLIGGTVADAKRVLAEEMWTRSFAAARRRL